MLLYWCYCTCYWMQAGELERVEREVNINLQGVGLSLVNDILHKEIAYMSISRSQFPLVIIINRVLWYKWDLWVPELVHQLNFMIQVRPVGAWTSSQQPFLFFGYVMRGSLSLGSLLVWILCCISVAYCFIFLLLYNWPCELYLLYNNLGLY